MARILLFDDDKDYAGALSKQLKRAGHEVRWFELAEDGLSLLVEDSFDLILLDNWMPRMSGLEVLDDLEKKNSSLPVILMTGAPDADTAIQAWKRRTFFVDYVIKPADFDAILPSMEAEIHRALKIGRPIAPVPIPSPHDQKPTGESGMIGQSKPMLAVFKSIAEIEADESVLILGETGTGKDLVARAIHTNSARKNHPFIAINCGALLENLLESELFGHERGAWTGADKLRKGYFEHAHGGTLFLDEVGDMPPALQVKLLRVLQNHEITRMGSCEPIEVDVRILAATSRDLVGLVHQGKFRKDLFFRLEDTTIDMPPLRERQEDVELLARHFLKQKGGDALTIHAEALVVLRHHPWPGNIRQLENVMRRARRAVRVRRGTEILLEDLNFGKFAASAVDGALSEESAQAGLHRAVAWTWKNEKTDLWPLLWERLEGELIRRAVTEPGISQVQLARRLGIAKNTLLKLLKKYCPQDDDAAT